MCRSNCEKVLSPWDKNFVTCYNQFGLEALRVQIAETVAGWCETLHMV